MKLNPIQHAIALSLIGTAVPSFALDFKPADGIDAKLSGTLTLGTMVRTDSPDPSVYSLIPSSIVPSAPTGALVGQVGGPDLNFEKGHAVSTVLKGLIDFDVHNKNVGLFARAMAWHDFTLGHRSAAYGNFANGYASGVPLSDAGFPNAAKFEGIDLRDAYVYGNLAIGEQSRLDARLGRQVLSWGTAQFVAGGINSAINPVDLAAQLRPGALPQESKVPLGMLNVKLTVDKQWGVEGFLPYESRQTVLPGCGTFFDIASLLPHGCMLAGAISAPIANTPISTIGSLTERSLLSNGFYVHRNDDVNARKSGQFGLAIRYAAPALNTDFGAYAMNTHSTMPAFRVTVENVNGATLPAGLAGGLARLSNPNGLRYATVYAENIRLFGASFDTRIDPTARVFGEVAYRPNQPLSMNPNDLLNGFLLRGPASLLQLNKNILAIPASGTFDAFDRYGVINASFGASKVFPKVLGAERVVLAAEVGVSHISGLPDPSVMRYGRPLAYGTAPYLANGALTACSEAAPGLSGVPGKTCTTDGFISKDAYGVRARIAATYANVVAGASLTPSLVVALDMHGYSYDGTYSSGRRATRVGLRADWGKNYFADIQYTQFAGGNYNLLADRSNVALAVGASF